MKRLLFVFVVVFSTVCANALTFECNLPTTVTKTFAVVAEGTKFTLAGIDERNLEVDKLGGIPSIRKCHEKRLCLLSKQGHIVPLMSDKDLDNLQFHPITNQDYWDAIFVKHLLLEIYENEKCSEKYSKIRREMNIDATEYVKYIEDYNLYLDDPLLENYIYSLIPKEVLKYISYNVSTTIRIRILKNPQVRARFLANGTLIINTGLLARLHTEDELVAVIVNELLHHILEHDVKNVSAQIDRQKRAKFWANVGTILTAVGEGVAAANNPNYIPGIATMSVALMAETISDTIVDRLGAKYTETQILTADKITVAMLGLLGYNPNAMATVIKLMQDYYESINTDADYCDSNEYKFLIKRVNLCGVPYPYAESRDRIFEQNVSFAVTNIAEMRYSYNNFAGALELTTQNVENGVATINDYIIRAYCLLNLDYTINPASEVMRMVNLAKQNPYTVVPYKIEILCALRTQKKEYVQELLESYVNLLDSVIPKSSVIEEIQYIKSERKWANDMLSKLAVFEINTRN